MLTKRQILYTTALCVSSLYTSACTHTIYRDRTVTVNVPVPQPCANPRPEAVAKLAEAYPDAVWSQMDVKQKAGAVSAQGLKLRTYGEQLDAATAACP